MFQVFELGIHGLSSIVIEAQEKIGGQCTELFPHKPIYDIPGLPNVTATQLVANLQEQIKSFAPKIVLAQEVTEIVKHQSLPGFEIITDTGQSYNVKYIVIATGAGAMTPVRLKVTGIEEFEDRSLFYSVKEPAIHQGKTVAILGGGDAAFDWAIELQKVADEIILIHRSNHFKAVNTSVNRYMSLCENYQAQFLQGQVTGYETKPGDLLAYLKVTCADRVVRRVAVDHVLVFFGLSPKIRQLQSWGLEMERFDVKVPTDTFESSTEGIFAIGDCNYYPGKKKLILSGFHEAALTAFAIKEKEQPDKKIHLEYTTTSPRILERLGVSIA